jgi:hypothetical protein
VTEIPTTLTKRQLTTFKKFLVESGAQELRLTNEWELMRVQVDDKTLILYKNKSGRLAWPEALKEAWVAFKSGGQIKWSGYADKVNRRKRTPVKMQTIAERDGTECFYCGEEGSDPEEFTMEHMLDASKGGGNHIHNLVLACRDCNQAVRHMSVAEKCRYREQKRQLQPVAIGVQLG